MSGAVQVGALVINMAADIASLKTNLNDATRAAQTASQKMAADLTGGLKSIEAALGPLQSLTVKFGSLERQMSSAKDSAVSLAKGLILGSAAGISIDALKNKILGVIDSMAHLKEVSEKTGSSVENLSKLAFVSKQAGSDIDSVASAVNKLSKGMVAADAETKGAGLALSYLGLSAKDAAGNLKDPAVLFVEISKKLDGYRDGAGKAAIAQSLFGKAGAEMLPTLKLLAEQGDIVAKVTDAQATAAQRYTRDMAKLEAQKGMLFKTLATALLPTMTDFANAMLDASKNTNIANAAVKDMAKDNGITDWADTAAMGVARLMDVIMMIPRALKAVSSSFKVVGNDIGLLATIVMKRNDPAAIALALGARNDALEEANGNYSDLWNSDGAKMEKAMAARIEVRAKATADARAAAAARAGADAAKPSLNFSTVNDDEAKAAQAAADKEAAAYATVITAIRAKTAENNLQLASNETLSESQKLQIKLDEELASGKIILSAKHREAANAALVEMAASEQLVKAQVAQKEVTKFIAASTAARDEASAALNVEYQMYGKSADARDIEMVAVKAEADMQKQLAALREKNLPISDQIITQLNAERDARVLVEQATMGQGKALQYAAQLAAENKKFGIDYIADDRQRAAAQLALDSQVWQERIRLAGEGTDAQKALQEQFDVWYRNQSIKPALDEQKKMWGSIEQTAHDTFISIFDSGKSAFDRLRDALKNGLLDLLYQITLKKWIINVQGSMSLSGTTTAASVAGSASSGLTGLAQGASNLYSMATGGMTLAGGLGTGFMGSLAGGLGGAGVGSGLTSSIGLSIGNSIAGVVGPAVSGALASGMGAIATALPWVGAAVAAISIGKMAFGMGSKETTSTGISGTLSDSGVTGQNYTDWKKKGGWFRSDQHGTDTSALSGDLVKQFTQGLSSLESAAGGFASSLGLSADAIKGYSKDFNIALTGDAAKDQQAITDFFTGVGNELATKLVPNLDQFSKSGEAVSATLQRLAGDFTATNQVAQMLGKSAVDVFGGLGMDSAAARERLIDLSGGVAALGQQAQSYAQNFLTDAEKLAPVQAALQAAMASLGLASVQTREQFKGVVDGLDLTTQAGAEEFASLMKLADAFAQVHPQIDAVAEAAAAAADAAKAAADATKAAADALQAMKDSASALLGGVDSAYSVLQNVVSREKAAVQTSIDAHSAAVSKLQSLSQSLHSTLDGMKSPDQQVLERPSAQAQIRAALAIARAGGPLPEADSLKNALSAVSKDASSQFGSRQDYLRDLYQTQSDIASLGDVTDSQLSVEQQALKAAQDQIKSLDGILSKAQQQVDVLKGIDTNGLSLVQAMSALTSAILNAKTNPIVGATGAINGAYQQYLGRAPDAQGLEWWQNAAAGGAPVSQIVDGIKGSTEASLNSLYQSVLGRAPDAEGLQFWMKAYGSTMDTAEQADWMKAAQGSDEYKKLHPFAIGTNFVPETMPALVHQGERIIPAADNRALMNRLSSPSGNSDALASAVDRLNATVERQNAIIDAQGKTIERVRFEAKRQADFIERLTNGGQYMPTKAVS